MILSSPPRIAPRQGPGPFPLWSVMILVNNQAPYVETCLRAILELDQGLTRMQIMVLDDASTTGNMEELVRKIGKGRIGYFRQPTRVGKLRNMETALKLAEGDWIHLFFGDSYVYPGFYETIESLFQQHPRVGAAFTEFEYINQIGNQIWKHEPAYHKSGLFSTCLLRLAERPLTQATAWVVKRSVYEQLGGFFGVEYGEFWEFSCRVAAHHEIAYSPKVLANFRIPGKRMKQDSFALDDNVTDTIKTIDRIRAYLPLDERERIHRASRKHFSQHYAMLSHKSYHEYEETGLAWKQAMAALQLDINGTSLRFAFLLFAKVLFGYRRIRHWFE